MPTCCDCGKVATNANFGKAQLKEPPGKRRCKVCAKPLAGKTAHGAAPPNPANNNHNGQKNWSNNARFSAAVDEWNNNRPRGKNNKLMSMSAFCKLCDIPRLTFLQHCKSDEAKEAEKK